MLRTFIIWAAIPLWFCSSGCMLDRSALGCPVGTMYAPEMGCVPVADADMSDAMVDPDAFMIDADAGPMPDAFIDPDAMVDPDGGTDAGTDGGFDGGRDAGPPPDAGMRRCEDTTAGYCFRFQNLAGSPEVTGWMIQFIWTLPGGSIYRLPDNRDPEGVPIYQAACDVFRRIDARTTECEVTVPDPGRTVISTGPFYAYPVYASGPACTGTGCPAYPAGYRMWSSGAEFSTMPADGRVSQESRPTTAGSIIVLRLIP